MSHIPGAGPDFQLPDEILSVIPTDPFEQLDLARKITSMAINSRVANLDSEVSRLKQKVVEKERVIVGLEDKVFQLQEAVHEAEMRFNITRDDNMKLVKERDTMALTVKKLSRDLAKLEAFKRQLLQSLDDNSTLVETADVDNYDQSVSMDNAMMPYISPRLTPTGTPNTISASVSPRGYYPSGSPRNISGTTSPIKSQYDGSGSLSSWFPSSQRSSVANSPPNERPLPARPPRIDGKEFFRQARSRLSYEQFSAFLSNIKELNAKRQSREETLRKAEEIFGTDNKDLHLSFQSMLNRSTR